MALGLIQPFISNFVKRVHSFNVCIVNSNALVTNVMHIVKQQPLRPTLFIVAFSPPSLFLFHKFSPKPFSSDHFLTTKPFSSAAAVFDSNPTLSSCSNQNR
ncbi:hypothetical protein MtrunA17_Chr1g0186041 [Medicago truncatula]|uniref:Uncharacterized protein n=1 Tax=Medicago truncatula TaxID=3880 RepID=A0A396JV81_MEDTR|nr:hypothetical protein MtrunA17_Chr1g0186041 [Medicago truncatula]